MLNKMVLTCYLIGDDHLLIKCAEILLNKGHKILGVISPLSAAEKFASMHQIEYFHSLENATNTLLTIDFDYLFSIINSSIIPLHILQRARHLPINFHNAPLPRYAGVHALSWAILNEESQYGVTWHAMTEVIDGGDLLKQAHFLIDTQETALSLSLKCYTHALSLFNELIDDIDHKTLIRTPQDSTHSSYYSFRQKPEGNGWINWNTPASHIERTVRALELGHYHHNRLAAPKIQIGSNIYIISKLRILDELSTTQPGSIIAIHPHTWHISTQTNPVSIEQVVTLDGESCSLDLLLDSQQFRVGDILPSPTTTQLTQYHSISERFAPSELFWVRTLTEFKPATLPFQPQNSHQYLNDTLIPLAYSVLTAEHHNQWAAHLPPSCQPMDVLLTTVLIYLYRLGNKDQSGIWIHDSPAQDVIPEHSAFFASLVPFSVSLDQKISFYEALKLVQKARMTVESKGTFQHDVFYRYPELAHIEHHHYPLALFIGTTKQCTDKLKRTTASVLITLSSDTNEMTWWIKQQLMNQEHRLSSIIQSSTQHIEHLINSLPSNLHQAISQLSLLKDEERQKILTQWHTTTTNYPKHKTIHQIFEEQVQLTPENTAVIYGKKSLTYSELNLKANQLARCLQKKGLGLNGYAAICTTQELHLIIGILAILKSGAAYIPIDASYPKQHIKSVLSDSTPTLLLASHHLSERVEHDCELLNIPIHLFSTLLDEMKHESGDNLKYVHSTAKSHAYVIYTSGSTGKPKGVMVPHQGVSRLVINTNYIHINEHDKIAQAASISFDAATFEIWGALLNGATLVAVPQATLLDPGKFATFIEKNGITILWLTSALFNQYAAQTPSLFRHLTYLLIGGDVLNKERIMSVLGCEQGSPKMILNGYGPTENTTFTTTYHITKDDKHCETIPIGKPIANSTVYVLDEFLQPTPVGAIGELYTGGDGLASGYLNRPDLNEKYFINNPFNSEKDSILYKTGDSVRWMPDGHIEYLGRQDNQVKIRGFRVELEAIQAHLLHHNEISQCCVRAEDSKQGKVLIAYIVCNEVISDRELHEVLSHQLPIYMIPGFFVRLDKMPLTANGKINYKKLPKPDLNKSISNKDYVAPITAREQSLATLWSKLLGIASIGMNDNFFALGGHSLLITQLILHVKETYKTDLPLHEFLEQPTISQLDQLIEVNNPQIHSITHNHAMFTDRFLPQELRLISPVHNTDKPQHILLTGASGFLGVHLLYDLYHSTSAIIHCLIRAKNEQEAVSRLNATLSKYQFELQCNERIKPLLGDLTNPQLGLSSSQFNHLSKIIDVIFHNGAAVNHLYNYELLRAANVNSTLDIIFFAMQNKLKSIHYVSTLSAASTFLDDSKSIIEGFIDVKHKTTPPNDGYSQTKWVAEQMLSEASSRGLSINIYRPGWIVGQSKTGAINAESNHLLKLIKSCIQLKVAPSWEMMLDMLPVDTISQVIIKNSLKNNNVSKVFNLINPDKISWTHLIQYINQRGYKVSLIDPIEWKEQHLKFIDAENALYSLYSLYINATYGDWMKGLSTISHANSYNTNNAFHELGQLMPKINEPLLDIYFNYLEKEGFIHPPFN